MKTAAALFSPTLPASRVVPVLAPQPRLRADMPRRYALGVASPYTMYGVFGVALAVHDSDPSGCKPAIVCLHAIGQGGGDFAELERALGAHYRFITIDWPRHGYSGNDSKPVSALRYAMLLEGLLDQLGLDRMVLLGNSIGGAAAIRYAARHPGRVPALVLANPGGLDNGASDWLRRLYIGNMMRHFASGVRQEPRFARWFASYYNEVLIRPAAQTHKEAIIAAGYEMAPVLLEAWDSFRQPEANLVPHLARLTMPVLVTWARRDRIVRWERNRAAIAQLPNGHVEMFNAGHAPFLETPDAFSRTLTAFLATLS